MASMKDIASEAGVSVPTVSFVLSGKADSVGINELTRAKVRRVAEKLDYRPNLAARGLRTKRSYVIGLMMFNPRELLYAEILTEIQALLLPHGYAGICAFWNTMEEARTAFRAVLDRGVDGLITCHDDLSLIPADMPAVLLFQKHARFDSVCRDGESSMRHAVHYLLDQGHHRLGALNINRPYYEPIIKAAMAERGVRMPVYWTTYSNGDYTSVSREGMTELLSLPSARRPTALICRNDTVAMLAISEAGRHGLSVPKDLSILGFDSVSLGELTNPPLTSFGIPAATLAKHVVDLMLRRLSDPAAPLQKLVLDNQLVERASCTPPVEAV